MSVHSALYSDYATALLRAGVLMLRQCRISNHIAGRSNNL